MSNVFDAVAAQGGQEIFTELLSRGGIRIERIVSTGQTTPVETPFDQDHDEWVLLLRGRARLWIDGEEEVSLEAGDHVLIPAHRQHRVTWTADNEPTIWLAVHFG